MKIYTLTPDFRAERIARGACSPFHQAREARMREE